jgi:transcriptional regulator with XRE-family HTH domain
MVKRLSVEEILAANLDALMGRGKKRKAQSFLASKGVSQSAIAEILRHDRSVRLRTLAIIAAEFNFQPWQLLVEGFDPKQPPLLQVPTGDEAAFYARIRKLAKDMGIDDGEEPVT